MKTSLILLTWNEIEGCRAVVDKIPRNSVDEILVVDAGSTDGTTAFFKKRKIPVVIQKRKGRGDAFKEGLKNSTGDVLVFFSPDGNENPADIPKLVEGIKKGNDLVIASRFMKGSKSEDAGFVRGFGNNMFTFFVNLLFGAHVRDAVNGFRAIRRDKLERLNLSFKKFEIELEMTIRAAKLGYKIKEIPTFEAERIGGESKAKTLSTGWLYVKTILKELLLGKGFLKNNK
ncbi:glycosyltransferase family 2 protein [Candidatus Micrarchaeota archaeon]|nr:glycosyltransferase family 2 protein [Candidatus Micrarchaeota archaeon]